MATIETLGKEIFNIIGKEKVSVTRDSKNRTKVRDSKSFKGLPLSTVDDITRMTDETTKGYLESRGKIKFYTIDSLEREARSSTARSVIGLQNRSLAKQVYDSYFNYGKNIGNDADINVTMAGVTSNIWISPFEANALYSQKGLPELITNKKSKTILMNGMKIKNKKLTQKQIDEISLNMVKINFPGIVSRAVRDALVYGGVLVVPMFKRDNPMTTAVPIEGLLKTGVLGKGTLDYFFVLDRWNVMHLPVVNPTQRDFLRPEKYFIPFLGSDVHHSRTARIITSDQAGYFGTVMTLGWGLSDFVGYMRSLINYKTAMQSIPNMIQQMSILVRSIGADSMLAQEGINALLARLEEDKTKVNETGPNNPISLDMVGELQVVNRQFSEVPSLLRLLRQDLAADALVPEPMLWSSEKGAFSSGDDTEGNLEKQSESMKYIHKDVEQQMKALANIIIIDALGTDKEIIDALPYTQLHFDVPIIANSKDRAKIGESVSTMYFNLVAANMPGAEAAKIASAYAGDEMSIDSEFIEELEKRQNEADARQKEEHDLDMAIKQQQLENLKNGIGGEGSLPSAKPAGKKGYSKLEQAQHSKTRQPGEKTPEMLAKARAKSKDSIIDRIFGKK